MKNNQIGRLVVPERIARREFPELFKISDEARRRIEDYEDAQRHTGQNLRDFIVD